METIEIYNNDNCNNNSNVGNTCFYIYFYFHYEVEAWGISLKWQYFVIMACISLKWHKNGCSKEGNASSDGPKAEQIKQVGVV